ncbi:biopolymer transporter ExbD [bacterium]|nr:biopolymer transporter ExbD [bacterium]
MAFSAGRKFGAAMAEINVTPLVDVVLVLLIIFMVTAPLMQRGIDVDLPRTVTQSADQEERIVVSVSKEGKIFIGDVQIQIEDLSDHLRRRVALTENPKAIFLRGDKTLRYEIIMQVMDEMKRSGVPTIGLVTEPAREKKKSAGGTPAVQRK